MSYYLSQKVAKRFFKKIKAGTFDPPPELLEDVSRFLITKYAGHILARTQDRIRRLRSDSVDFEAMYDRIKNVYYDAPWSELEPGRSETYPLRPDINKEIRIYRSEDPTNNYAYAYVRDGKEGRVFNGRDGFGYYYRELREKLYDAYNKALNELHTKKRNQKNMESDSDVNLVELKRLEKLASKYAKKPREYKSTARTWIEVDLSGWSVFERALKDTRNKIKSRASNLKKLEEKLPSVIQSISEGQTKKIDISFFMGSGISYKKYDYDVEITRSEDGKIGLKLLSGLGKDPFVYYSEIEALEELQINVEEALDSCLESLEKATEGKVYKLLEQFSYDKIKVILDFKGHTRRGGQWSNSERELQVDMPKDAKQVADFKENIRTIASVSEHECQHYGQYAFKALKDLKENIGLPPKKLRNLKFDPSGYDTKNYKQRRPHALRDIEFQTRLTDEIDEFVSVAKRIPVKYRKKALRYWVSDSNEEIDELVRNVINPNLDRPKLDKKHFFYMLKNREQEKWRKAIKEFVGELSKRSIRMNP